MMSHCHLVSVALLSVCAAVLAEPAGPDGARRLEVPVNATLQNPCWSPGGRRIAFETCLGDPDRSAGTRLRVVEAPCR